MHWSPRHSPPQDSRLNAVPKPYRSPPNLFYFFSQQKPIVSIKHLWRGINPAWPGHGIPVNGASIVFYRAKNPGRIPGLRPSKNALLGGKTALCLSSPGGAARSRPINKRNPGGIPGFRSCFFLSRRAGIFPHQLIVARRSYRSNNFRTVLFARAARRLINLPAFCAAEQA
ncbi:hypothetical protein SDC9_120433 [bioreactor metagenome]|uniref:Uncharacterized protein n=1 Tax=bioreactor metagenome TaxID=1076179 RepID=A0A645C9A1_9ZZZZ